MSMTPISVSGIAPVWPRRLGLGPAQQHRSGLTSRWGLGLGPLTGGPVNTMNPNTATHVARAIVGLPGTFMVEVSHQPMGACASVMREHDKSHCFLSWI